MNRCEFVGRLRGEAEFRNNGEQMKMLLGVGVPDFERSRGAFVRTIWVGLVWNLPDGTISPDRMPYKGDQIHVVCELVQHMDDDGAKRQPTQFRVVTLTITERTAENRRLAAQGAL